MVNVNDCIDKPARTTQCPGSKPTLYDYFLDCNKKQWIAWDWIVPKYEHDPEMKFSEILVPTVDTLRTEQNLSLMNKVNFCYLSFMMWTV